MGIVLDNLLERLFLVALLSLNFPFFRLRMPELLLLLPRATPVAPAL